MLHPQKWWWWRRWQVVPDHSRPSGAQQCRTAEAPSRDPRRTLSPGPRPPPAHIRADEQTIGSRFASPHNNIFCFGTVVLALVPRSRHGRPSHIETTQMPANQSMHVRTGLRRACTHSAHNPARRYHDCAHRACTSAAAQQTFSWCDHDELAPNRLRCRRTAMLG